MDIFPLVLFFLVGGRGGGLCIHFTTPGTHGHGA